jgi:hypothetical protein
MRIFAEKYGEDFIRVGVGCVITISENPVKVKLGTGSQTEGYWGGREAE